MTESEKCCVLAIDVSSSVNSRKLYWDKVKELLNEVLAKNYSSYKCVTWNHKYKGIYIETLHTYIQKRRGYGGSYPYLVWDYLQALQLSTFDLHLITDGEIDCDQYNRYIDEYNRLTIQPDIFRMHYIGRVNEMNMEFLDCFKTVEYVVHGYYTNKELVTYTSMEISKNYLFDQLCDIQEFKQIKSKTAENILDALEKLYKTLTIMEKLYKTLSSKMAEYSGSEMDRVVRVEFKKFVDLVSKFVHCNYIAIETENEAAMFDGLFLDYKSNSKEIFDIFVKRFVATTSMDYRKVLSQIIELGNGRRSTAYGENWHERAKNDMGPMQPIFKILNDNKSEVEIDDVELGNKKESNTSCPILLLDSAEYDHFCVIWIGIDTIFGGNNREYNFDLKTKRKLEKSALRLYEFLSPEKLNKKVPPANPHISIDAFDGLRSDWETVDGKRCKRIFRSPVHQANCFGIIVYSPDSESTWPAKMTRVEEFILLHNFETISQLLFGDSNFVGSFSLLHTFFLHILYQCDRIDPYMKVCIMETIKRSSVILKCRFMIESGVEPNFYSTVQNFIIFHSKIYPNAIDKLTTYVPGIYELNIPRKYIYHSSGFLSLAKSAFGVNCSADYQKQLKKWQFWNHMFRGRS